MRIKRLALMALFLTTAWPLLSQTFGEISGEVRDPSGSAVVGASVTATNTANGAIRSVVTNDAGLYSFPSLQPGIYSVKVTLQGFQAVTRPDVELQVQQTARLDFALQLGQVSEVVEVAGGAPM